MRRFKEGSGHDRPFFQMEKSSVLNSHNKSSKNRPHDPPPPPAPGQNSQISRWTVIHWFKHSHPRRPPALQTKLS